MAAHSACQGMSLPLMNSRPGAAESDSARDVIQMVTLTFSIKGVDRACVVKLKKSKYMSPEEKKKA